VPPWKRREVWEARGCQRFQRRSSTPLDQKGVGPLRS
jgi:hypothetical protein